MFFIFFQNQDVIANMNLGISNLEKKNPFPSSWTLNGAYMEYFRGYIGRIKRELIYSGSKKNCLFQLKEIIY